MAPRPMKWHILNRFTGVPAVDYDVEVPDED